MKLEEMTKEEILEAIDTLSVCDCCDPESIYSDRSDIVDGVEGDFLWEKCKKYRESLINYIYRKEDI